MAAEEGTMCDVFRIDSLLSGVKAAIMCETTALEGNDPRQSDCLIVTEHNHQQSDPQKLLPTPDSSVHKRRWYCMERGFDMEFALQ
jgi:hypothetical protein